MLKFDSYASDAVQIDNGIGQGDPLLMVLYQFYNADLLDIPNSKDKDAMAFVDNSFVLAVADSFEEAHIKLVDMMGKAGCLHVGPKCMVQHHQQEQNCWPFQRYGLHNVQFSLY